jgi:multidrug efflux pump subunit AcrA (membrane-fusion protein)
MPIVPILIFIIAAIISSVMKAQKKQAQAQAQAQKANRSAYPPANSAPSNPSAAPARTNQTSSSSYEQRARQEELKRRLEENRARREAEQRAMAEQRNRLEKAPMQTALKAEKPVASHTDEDCGGGSIHDGYHEGVTQFDNGRPAAVAGKLGKRLADEDERIEKAHEAADNAKRVMARIAKLPPLSQGIVYSEILGKPKSEAI